MNLKQFKLVSGQEFLCEVIDVDYESTDLEPIPGHIVCRNAMEIVSKVSGGATYYMFSPWMHYVEQQDDVFILNMQHVMCTSIPKKTLEYRYKYAVQDMHEIAAEVEMKVEQQMMEEVATSIVNAFEESSDPLSDSDVSNNIISFPRGPLH